ncbi:MAG: hypothetical protein WB562_12600, partial [Candidatus Sulfotelmatobacter sp.]
MVRASTAGRALLVMLAVGLPMEWVAGKAHAAAAAEQTAPAQSSTQSASTQQGTPAATSLQSSATQLVSPPASSGQASQPAPQAGSASEQNSVNKDAASDQLPRFR